MTMDETLITLCYLWVIITVFYTFNDFEEDRVKI